MNKVMLIPLAFMFMLTIFAFVYTATDIIGTSPNYENQTGIHIQNDTGNVNLPSAGSHDFNIWDNGAGAAMVILISAIAVGIVAGIKVLGSGLSGLSQSLIFNGILFMGLWACLSIISGDFLYNNGAIPSLLWVSMTVMYIVGLGIHLNDTGD